MFLSDNLLCWMWIFKEGIGTKTVITIPYLPSSMISTFFKHYRRHHPQGGHPAAPQGVGWPWGWGRFLPLHSLPRQARRKGINATSTTTTTTKTNLQEFPFFISSKTNFAKNKSTNLGNAKFFKQFGVKTSWDSIRLSKTDSNTLYIWCSNGFCDIS